MKLEGWSSTAQFILVFRYTLSSLCMIALEECYQYRFFINKNVDI